MIIDIATLKRMLLSGAQNVSQNIELLTQLDAQFGDGDHGVTMGKICGTIQQKTQTWDLNECKSIGAFFQQLGTSLFNTQGGSAGFLWGAWMSGLATPSMELTEIDVDALYCMMTNVLEEMADVTSATIGDKTIMDAMIPAFTTPIPADRKASTLFLEASKRAREGAERTREFISKFGKSRNSQERTIGELDPGAISFTLFIEGMCMGLNS